MQTNERMGKVILHRSLPNSLVQFTRNKSVVVAVEMYWYMYMTIKLNCCLTLTSPL
jgi:tmRNA-binding protein